MIIFCWSCRLTIFGGRVNGILKVGWIVKLIQIRKLIRLSILIRLSGLSRLTVLISLSALIWLISWSGRVIWIFSRFPELFSNSKTFIVSDSAFLIPYWLVISDLRRGSTLRRNYLSGAKSSGQRSGVISFFAPTRIYVEIVHYVEIFLQAPRTLIPVGARPDRTWDWNYPEIPSPGFFFAFAVDSELIRFGASSDLRWNFPADTSELIPYSAHLDRLLGFVIPEDSFSVLPPRSYPFGVYPNC